MAPGATISPRLGITTRYAVVAVRTLVDPVDPKDVETVHTLQNAIKLEQPGGPGAFKIPQWDHASQKKVRDALLIAGRDTPRYETYVWRQRSGRTSAAPDRRGFGLGRQSRTGCAVSHCSAGGGTTALGPTQFDGQGRAGERILVDQRLQQEKGYFEPNALNAYTLNNITAKKASDGSIDVRFGNCDASSANCLPIMPGWNYLVRLYRPRPGVLDGDVDFPRSTAGSKARCMIRGGWAPPARGSAPGPQRRAAAVISVARRESGV